MMASSTSSPIATARPPSVMTLIDSPQAHKSRTATAAPRPPPLLSEISQQHRNPDSRREVEREGVDDREGEVSGEHPGERACAERRGRVEVP